jgi:acyl carrier protein
MESAEKARRLLAEVLDIGTDALPSDASMDTLPVWDSLNHIRLISRLEEELGRPIEGGEIVSITNLPSLAALLNAERP